MDHHIFHEFCRAIAPRCNDEAVHFIGETYFISSEMISHLSYAALLGIVRSTMPKEKTAMILKVAPCEAFNVQKMEFVKLFIAKGANVNQR